MHHIHVVRRVWQHEPDSCGYSNISSTWHTSPLLCPPVLQFHVCTSIRCPVYRIIEPIARMILVWRSAADCRWGRHEKAIGQSLVCTGNTDCMIGLPAHGCAALLGNTVTWLLLRSTWNFRLYYYQINYVVSMYLIKCQPLLTCRRVIMQSFI